MKLSTKICAAIAPLGLMLALVSPGALATTVSACDAVTGNLVKNCGFELGTLNDWGLSGGEYDSLTQPASIHTGSHGLEFAGNSVELTQAIATTADDSYALTFYLLNSVGYSISLGLKWGDSVLLPYGTSGGPTSWTKYSYTGLGSGSPSTLLALYAATSVNGNPMYVDDFSVVDTTASVTPTPPSNSVPEPPAAPLFGLGLAGIGFMLVMRRRRHKDDGMTEPR